MRNSDTNHEVAHIRSQGSRRKTAATQGYRLHVSIVCKCEIPQVVCEQTGVQTAQQCFLCRAGAHRSASDRNSSNKSRTGALELAESPQSDVVI